MNRKHYLAASPRFLIAITLLQSLIASHFVVAAAPSPTAEKPNVIVIFCDDLGYGDLGCYGNPTIRTPELDRMAAEGLKLTQFYACSSVCTPSRSGLLTGRLPQRTGMWGNRRVLFPDSVGGLPHSEITIAEKMKEAGYVTACVGKWHLGHLDQYLPANHGFDDYFGIPYSNDMDNVSKTPGKAVRNPMPGDFNVPLLESRNGGAAKVIERPADQTTITRKYTERSIQFIREHTDQPFFLYLAHSMPHVPLFRSAPFIDKSLAGIYGDVIEEIDWSVGQILQTLRELHIEERTLVVFTSDNGPWLVFDEQGGSAGPLREGKGSTWEGGMREPALIWWPGEVPAGVSSSALCSTLDLLPTCCRLAGVAEPEDRVLDGFDMLDTWTRDKESPRKWFYYYRGDTLMAVRNERFKAHLRTQDGYGPGSRTPVDHNPFLVYDLNRDPGEKRDVRERYPEVVELFQNHISEHRSALEIAPSQLDRKE